MSGERLQPDRAQRLEDGLRLAQPCLLFETGAGRVAALRADRLIIRAGFSQGAITPTVRGTLDGIGLLAGGVLRKGGNEHRFVAKMFALSG